MDKETLSIIDGMVVKAADTAASNAVAKMREFHLDDLKVLGERMEMGFKSIDRRFDAVNERFDGIDKRFDAMDKRFDGIDTRLDGMDIRFDAIEIRLDRVEHVLETLIREMKEYRENVDGFKKQISDLTVRVKFLEEKLATTR